MAFLRGTCAGCHEKGANYQSFWSFEKAKLTPETFQVDPMSYRVYQAIKLKSLGAREGPPAPMPPGEPNEKHAQDAKRFLLWAKGAVPDVVLEAHANYPDAEGSGNLKVIFDFKCEKPVSFRQYIRRVTNDAFDREPFAQELEMAGRSPDVPTTKELRERVAAKFREDPRWAIAFKSTTLRKFTDKIASVEDIVPAAGVTADIVADLRDEFYELVKAKVDSSSWKDILLSDEVMVTSRTAEFYGASCLDATPPPGVWASCRMDAPRGSFFTTMGYLLSKRSSFLEINNNYGRAATMNLVLTGELLSAATDGPRGDTSVRPLPTCLKTKDFRGKLSGDNVAPYGSAKVPAFGNVCQSCHISRHMAAGSILFRPFTAGGKLFVSEMIDASLPEVAEAIAQGHVNAPKDAEPVQVDVEFLQSLLSDDGSEAACAPGKSASEAAEPLRSVKALAQKIASSDRAVAKGLARHVPRALSNLSSTTLEIQDRVVGAYEKNDGKLGPVFEAYFSSETYACEKRE
jgi:hypothetical protein